MRLSAVTGPSAASADAAVTAAGRTTASGTRARARRRPDRTSGRLPRTPWTNTTRASPAPTSVTSRSMASKTRTSSVRNRPRVSRTYEPAHVPTRRRFPLHPGGRSTRRCGSRRATARPHRDGTGPDTAYQRDAGPAFPVAIEHEQIGLRGRGVAGDIDDRVGAAMHDARLLQKLSGLRPVGCVWPNRTCSRWPPAGEDGPGELQHRVPSKSAPSCAPPGRRCSAWNARSPLGSRACRPTRMARARVLGLPTAAR